MNPTLSELASDIMLKVMQERPLSITPILGLGEVNSIFLAEMTIGKYVVRLNTEDDSDQFKKETWCSTKAIERGVPSPMPVAYGESSGAIYTVHKFIEGENGSTYTGDKSAMWFQIGSHTRLIHSIPVSGFGETLMDEHQHRFKASWQQFVTYNIQSLSENDPLLSLNVITQENRSKVRQIFETLLQTPFTFGLNHGDISEKNVLVDYRSDVYLLDWGSAEAHIVPHFDLFVILSESLSAESAEFAAFLEGYGLSQSEFKKLQPEVGMLTALTFIDKLRWAIDRSPDDIAAFAQRAAQAINMI
jgi:Ser/Thr protein kinase RdoA (MazF antagonist)